MRLSEAILLGSTMNPQDFYAIKSLHGTCAIGAALEAVGINVQRVQESSYSPQTTLWPWAYNKGISNIKCPACELLSSGLGTIAHLNDQHRWTREQIAEWVAKIEPAETVEPVVESITEAVCA